MVDKCDNLSDFAEEQMRVSGFLSICSYKCKLGCPLIINNVAFSMSRLVWTGEAQVILGRKKYIKRQDRIHRSVFVLFCMQDAFKLGIKWICIACLNSND